MKYKQILLGIFLIIFISTGVFFFLQPQNEADFLNLVVKLHNNSDSTTLAETCVVDLSPTSILSIYNIRNADEEQYLCLTTQEAVEWLEESSLTFAAGIPGDPDWAAQHSLEQVNAPEAWDTTTGDDSIVVAVIDTGVDYSHPDLLGTLLPGFDFANGDSNAQDDNGHGTHVAGIIAAQHNSQGIAGISPDVHILPVKVLDANGVGSILNSAMGIRYAVDQGADIINISYSSQFESQIEQEAIQYALNNGVMVVAASGDDGLNSVGYPAAFSGVISVGAIDVDYQQSSNSNFSHLLDLSAPGSGIYSTCLQSTQDNPYCIWSGTSMSAAHVTGLMVLLKTAYPNATNLELLDQSKYYAMDLGVSGYDNYFGAGLINLAAAIQENFPLPTYQILDSTVEDTDFAWLTLNTPTILDFSETSQIEVNLPFDFHFGPNETAYTSIFVHQDGYISLGSQVLVDESANLPMEKSNFEIISPFWDDLALDENSLIQYQLITDGENNTLVIEWNGINVLNYESDEVGSVVFQVQITDQHTNPAAPDNDLGFVYQSLSGVSGSGESASIGLGFTNGTGAQYCVNAPQGCVVEQQALQFYQLHAPGQSGLTEQGEIIFDPRPEFIWQPVPFADFYRLYISNANGTFWNMWYSADNVCTEEQCSLSLDVDLPDSNYHWWIQTSNIYGGGPWSDSDSFSLITAPDAPELIAPIDQSTINPPEFSWNEVYQTTDYRLVIIFNSSTVFDQWLTASEICSDDICTYTPELSFAHGEHSWQVQGSNLAGTGDFSDPATFQQINPPTAPALLAPSGTIEDVQPEFSWVHVDTADSYILEIYLDDQIYLTAYPEATDVCDATTCRFTPENPLEQGDFTWRAASSNQTGDSDWSDELSFSIDALPGQPALIAPSGTIYSSTPQLNWYPVEKADQYRIYINNIDGVVLNTWQDATTVCDDICSYTLGFDLQVGNFTWYIQAANQYGSGPWSDPMQFSVDLSPQKAVLVSPVGTIDTIEPVFSWSKATNVDQYRLYLLNGSGTLVNTWLLSSQVCAAESCQLSLDNPLPNGNYTWFIQTKQGSIPGPWSDAGRFAVLAIPETPTLISPLEVHLSSDVILQWSDEFNTVEYRVYLSGPTGTLLNMWIDPEAYCAEGVCTYPLNFDLYYGTYHWFIKGRNWAGSSDWTEAGKFYVDTIPGAAQLISPQETLSLLPITLTWRPVSGSSLYRVYITSNSGVFLNSWFSASELCSSEFCQFSIEGLDPGTYTWFIQTKNEYGGGLWSDSLKFTYSP